MAAAPHQTINEVGETTLYNELARRAAAVAKGRARAGDDLGLPELLSGTIDAAELRARAVARAAGGSEESRRGAALDFVADVATSLALDGSGDAGSVVSDAAAAIGISLQAANLAVFQRAVAGPSVAKLPPPSAYRTVVALMRALAPVEAVSLWTSPSPGRITCIASAGAAAASRRMRLAARVVLSADTSLELAGATKVRAVSVERWDEPHAALVARARPGASHPLDVYLAEGAAALTPFFERERLFERNVARELTLAAAAERLLTRLGCDLHDGPLQQVVALADDLRLARDQVASLLEGAAAARVRGRFDDLEARLGALDDDLRHLSQAVRSTSAVSQPLEVGLRSEVEAFNRSGGIAAQLSIRGDLVDLTASQRIVCIRVVQESLSNARRHSGATHVRVDVRSTRRYVSVTVADNGCGFDLEAAKRSGRLGLTGVIERVQLLGGDVSIDSAPGRGTRVRATSPRWSGAVAAGAPADAATASV